MLMIRYFRSAGATGHVFFARNGKKIDKGIAYSALIGPKTTVAVVPTTPQILDFTVDAKTKDNQTVQVTGNVKVLLVPQKAESKLDFTVDAATGAYKSPWQSVLRALVVERVLGPVRAKVRLLDVADVISANADIEKAVTDGITSGERQLSEKGVEVESCSAAKIEPQDEEVGESIGAPEREAMLTEADDAVHTRRIRAAENERAVQTYEVKTQLEVEKERNKLITKQGKNKIKEATDDAEATKKRLAPFAAVEAGPALAAALMQFAEKGHVENLSIGPELFTAIARK